MRDGNPEVTPQQLAEQRELGRFARPRAEAARRKADRAAADEAERWRAALRDQAAAMANPGGPLDTNVLAATYLIARDSTRAFITASETYAAISEVSRLLAAADVPDSRHRGKHEPGLSH
ncbi:hypothetical protein ACFWB2_32445 [Streptomyces virginiae]|uniref:hypothetical protein n=1 Tax=Streptomyces virginiae TaxID=1961 RepID=UPI0036AB4625